MSLPFDPHHPQLGSGPYEGLSRAEKQAYRAWEQGSRGASPRGFSRRIAKARGSFQGTGKLRGWQNRSVHQFSGARQMQEPGALASLLALAMSLFSSKVQRQRARSRSLGA